jgi:hypothetical protein
MRRCFLVYLLLVSMVPTARGGYPAAYVSHTAPARVAGGALFSVLGAGFGDVSGTVRIGETECEVVAWADTRLRVRAPLVAMNGAVTVVTGGETLVGKNPIYVAYRPAPDLPSIAVLVGPGAEGKVVPGDVLTLQGKGFGTTAAEVTFATDPSLRYPVVTAYADVPTGEIKSWSDTEIDVVVPQDCHGESYVLVSLPGFVLLAPSRVVCPDTEEP